MKLKDIFTDKSVIVGAAAGLFLFIDKKFFNSRYASKILTRLMDKASGEFYVQIQKFGEKGRDD